VPDEALRAYPGLRGANGRTVVAGIRSQFLHPAAERPDLPTLTGRIELVEALGSDSMVYLHVDANAVREGRHADQDVVEEAGAGVGGVRPNLVADFPSHVQLRLTDEIPVAVDVAKLHFFEGDSGEPLR